MEAETLLRVGEDAHAHLGREVETPRIFVLLEHIIIGRELCIGGPQLQPRIGLQHPAFQKIPPRRHTEGQLKYRMFLRGRQGRSRAQDEGFAAERPDVRLVVDEGADRDVFGHEPAGLEVHAPAGGLVGEAAAQRNPDLPIDIDVGAGDDLAARGTGGEKERQHEGCPQDGCKVCFHGL